MRGTGIAGLICLLCGLPTSAQADSISEAARLARSDSASEQRAAIRMLVRLDSRGAVRVLERIIRDAVKDMERLASELDGLLDDHYALMPRVNWILKQYERGRNMDAVAEAVLERLERLDARIDAARAQLAGPLSVVEEGVAALAKFRDSEAWKSIDKGASRGAVPLMRQLYLRVMAQAEHPESVEVLKELVTDRDPRIRAAAARSLVAHVRKKGVVDAVAGLANDEYWPVRLAAMKVMVGAPFEQAVAHLVVAAAREKGELAAVASDYLTELTGVSFPHDPTHWLEWWRKNEKELRQGVWEPPEKEAARDGPRTVASFFRIPIVSERVVFVLDFSGSMSEPIVVKDKALQSVMSDHGLPNTRLGYAKAEFIRALGAMRNGARFNVLGYSNRCSRFKRGLVELTSFTRRQAIKWVKELTTDKLTNIFAALNGVYGDYLDGGRGARLFGDLPDTVLFLTDGIATHGRVQERQPLLFHVDIWNRCVGTVFHCVGIGAKHDKELLKALARKTGGYYVNMALGLKPLSPRRRPLPKGVQLARPGASPAAKSSELRGLLDDLASGHAKKQIAAAKALGDSGAAAAFAVEELVDLLDDYDGKVQVAAADALARIGPRAVPALMAAAADDDDPDIVGHVATALKRIGKPAAARAIGVLEKHKDHWDTDAQARVLEALEALRKP